MKENRESLPIYIAVDSTRIVRCQWCGSAESDNWRRNRYGIYCSNDCAWASSASLSTCLFVFSAILVLAAFALISSRSYSDYPIMTILVGTTFGVLLSSPCLICAKLGWDHRRRVPQGSRRDETTSDLSLLKALSGVSCPKCNGNIDIRKVGEDRVYRCEYCGASGTIEVVKTH